MKPEVAAATAHLALLATIQCGNFYGYLVPAGVSVWHEPQYLLTIPFIQGQNVIAAAVLALLVAALARYRAGRWAAAAVYLLLTAGLLIDQIYYKVFLDHVHFSLFEGGYGFNPGLMLSSARHEIDGVWTMAAAVAAAGTAWVWWRLFAEGAAPRAEGRGSVRAVAVGGLLLLIGLPAIGAKHYFNLNDHPVWSMARDLARGPLASALAKEPEHAAPAAAGTVDHEARFAALPPPAKGRNVILIVLESVGALDLVTDGGLPPRAIAPNLRALADKGVLFDEIYAPFPGTTRSHISIHTGGQNPTLSGARELSMPYRGETLPRDFTAMGYETALFSSARLDGEYSDVFLGNIGFAKFQDFAQDINRRDPRYYIHSWGAREDYTAGLIAEWIDAVAARGRPFYLEYLTVATHHPYGVPAGYPPALPPGGRKADYLNALQYTDRAIGQLLQYLERRGLREKTVIATTGDHGEAFGDRHPLNLVHRNFLYEENVREFLIMSDPAVRGPMRSGRVADNGAILPTLVARAGGAAGPRDLLAADFEQRPVYFHKLASPEQFGLRDGAWKYIGDIRTHLDELYDLAADPGERVNLAPRYPEKTAAYRAMCEEWMRASDEEYRKRLR
ncbi:MAG TPA: sulfatase-like hydrolase/transferase [Bryobacteraceae bacterium]|nr:sulfatase-like hydrolase/transferase [Bryobacteraceae bacterium]